MEWWNDGMMERWNGGMVEWLNGWMVEWWNDGMMELWKYEIIGLWNNGMMEWWNDGIMEWLHGMALWQLWLSLVLCISYFLIFYDFQGLWFTFKFNSRSSALIALALFRIAFTAYLLRKSSQWKLKFPITWTFPLPWPQKDLCRWWAFSIEIGEVGDWFWPSV